MIAPTVKKKGGRPKGSKTRPDAPSKLARAAKLHAVRDAKGHFIPAAHAAGAPVAAPATNPVASPAVPTPASAETRPDTELFGAVPDFDKKLLPGQPDGSAENAESPHAETAAPENETGSNETPPETETTAESQRPLATVLWDTIIQILVMTVGSFWYPRKVGTDVAAGETPFDEREMVITAFCEYFHAVGVAVLTPVQKLWLAILAYSMPRLGMTVNWLKARFAKKKKTPPPATDSRFAPSGEKPAEDLKSAKTPENTPPGTVGEINGTSDL